jgi:uncharacterized protein
MIEPKNGKYLTSADFQQWQDYMSPLIDSYDKCIGKCSDCKSCGSSSNLKVKNITFVVTEGCNLNCTYCLPKGTKILTDTFEYKNIEDIEKGDKLLGFEEYPTTVQRKILPTKVIETYKHTGDVIRLTFEDDTYLDITKNHPILTRRGKNSWREAGRYKIGQEVRCLSNPDIINIDYNDINYIKGYFIAMMLGDGSTKKYVGKNGYNVFKIRLAVKDDEIIDRMKEYIKILEVDMYLKDFRISTFEGDVYKPALFANTEKVYNKIKQIIEENFCINESFEYYCGFLAGIYDAEGHIDKDSGTIRICNSNQNILNTTKKGLDLLNIKWVLEKTNKFVNLQTYNVRILSGRIRLDNLKFIKQINPSVVRKGVSNFYNRCLMNTKIIKNIEQLGEQEVFNIATESRTYFANNIAVHNCYESHKTNSRMTKETAKNAIDFLFDEEKVNGYYKLETSPACILEFIGGEPLLEIDLMNYIVEYFKFKAFSLNHPWATNYMISFTSNGVLFRDKKVQDFLKRNTGRVSIGITIDGNKELHDACRVFHDGTGSYDIVEKSIKEWLKSDGNPQTKITLAPENVMFLNDALKNVWSLGIVGAFTNVVFEDVWLQEHSTILYSEMIKLADYLLEDENYSKYYCSLFDETIGQVLIEDRNYCGGNGEMLAIGTDGRCFPCIRFMKYSLSSEGRQEQPIGDIYNGLDRKEDNAWLNKLKDITMSSQCHHDDNKKCLDCPIASGCSLCTAYNYDKFGDANHKATFICEMHKARVMSNAYFWNKLYKKLNISKRFDLNIPKDWALKIVTEEEYNKLLTIGGE